jgi:hypothetical protein
MFKDHKNFVKLRNQVNNDEEKHRKMYLAIVDKISNQEYL